MNTTACYSPDELRDFALGNLTEQQCEQIESHVQNCPACEQTVATFDTADDSLVRHLRAPQQESSHEDDDQYREALKHVQELEPGVPHATASPIDSDNAAYIADVSAAGGVLLRDYRLTKILGHGGMGTVYEAVHTRLDMPVAVKVLPERRMQDAAAVARFQREMRTIGKLDNPAIVRATDAGEVDGTHFLVMELVDGIDLGSLVQCCGPLAIADACELIRQAALGIDHAHQRGIVHRDIKPSNLMLSVEGRGLRVGNAAATLNSSPSTLDPQPSTLSVKILDLGLALLAGLHGTVDELTTVGQLMGTLDYMAPEQCDDSHEVDQRADIYGLAATLYKLICGEAPYGGPQFKTPLKKLRAIATTPVLRIEQRRGDVPPQLADVIHRGLAASPDERYASAAEFAEAISTFAVGSDLAALWTAAEAKHDPDTGQDPLPDWATSQFFPRRAAAQLPAQKKVDPAQLPDAKSHSGRKRLLVAAAVVATAMILVAGILIYIETGKGTLTIESARDDVGITILRSDKFYKQLELHQGQNAVRVGAGNYEIRLDSNIDGIEMKDGSFTLKRGEKWIARIVEQTQEPAPAVATRTRLNENLVDALMRREQLRQSYGDDHPEVRQLETEIAMYRRLLGENALADGKMADSSVPLYEGRTFDEWALVLKVDQSLTSKANAIEAILALGKDKPAHTVETILTALRREDLERWYSDGRTQGTIIQLLNAGFNQMDQEALLDALLLALKRGTTVDRYVALRFMSGLVFSDAMRQKVVKMAPEVLAATYDGDFFMRDWAIWTLVKSAPQTTGFRQRLEELMRDEDIVVVVTAATAMVYVNPDDPSLVDKLVEIARTGTNLRQRAQALLGLHHLGPRAAGAVAALNELVETDTDEVRAAPDESLLIPLRGEQDSFGWRSRLGFGLERPREEWPRVSLQDLAIMALGAIGPPAKSAAAALESEYKRRSELVARNLGSASDVRPDLVAEAIERITGSRPDSPPRDPDMSSRSSRPSGPVYEGKTLDQWLSELKQLSAQLSGPFNFAIQAAEILRTETSKEQLEQLVADWKKMIERERSPDRLAGAVQVICVLAGKDFSQEAVDAVIGSIRRRPQESFFRSAAREYGTSVVHAAKAHLGRLDEAIVRQKLLDELKSGDSTGRAFALEYLYQAPKFIEQLDKPEPKLTDDEIAALLAACEDSEVGVRVYSLRLVIQRGYENEHVRSQLKTALQNEKSQDLYDVVYAWLHVDPHNPGLIAIVGRWAKSDDHVEMNTAVRCAALGGTKNPEFVDILAKWLDEPAWGAKKVLGQPWGRGPRPSIFPRFSAIRALFELGPRAQAAVPVLEKQLQHPDSSIRQAAADAIEKITGKRPALPQLPEDAPLESLP